MQPCLVVMEESVDVRTNVCTDGRRQHCDASLFNSLLLLQPFSKHKFKYLRSEKRQQTAYYKIHILNLCSGLKKLLTTHGRTIDKAQSEHEELK